MSDRSFGGQVGETVKNSCDDFEISPAAASAVFEDAIRGQIVKPDVVPNQSYALSVAELVSAVPSASSVAGGGGAGRETAEKIEWVSFQHFDLTDVRLRKDLLARGGGSLPDGHIVLLMVLGLSRGYQIWGLTSCGECEELVSDRQGPVKLARLLPYPTASGTDDPFDAQRPLVAVVDNLSLGGRQQHCSLSVVSLRTGRQVHAVNFDQPIARLLCNSAHVVVVFSNRIVILDPRSFLESLSISGVFGDDQISYTGGPAVALGGSWLAYNEAKLNKRQESAGGFCPIELPSYTNQVYSAAKKLTQTVGETVVGTAATNSVSRQPPVVSVRALSSSSANSPSNRLVHFAASEPGGTLATLEFAPDRRLLLTGGASSHKFQLFRLDPHPSGSRLSAVQHLYTLYRGNTPARVESVGFSVDCRWVSLATNHGTTHIFPITPYGGAVSYRSHGGVKVVNKQSRFHRTAGLADGDTADGSTGRPPICVTALAKVNRRPLSTESLSAMVNDLSLATSASAPSGGAHPPPIYSGAIAIRLSDKADLLYVLSQDGTLLEYSLCIKPATPLSSTSTTSETPVQLTAKPTAQWLLQRTKSSADIRPPLPITSPLLLATDVARRRQRQRDGRRVAKQKSDTSPASNNTDRNTSTSTSKLMKKRRKPVVTAASKRPQTTSSASTSGIWISQVEMVTYAGPHRRLWMGPQLTFKTVVDASLGGCESSTSSSLHSVHAGGGSEVRSVPVVVETTSDRHIANRRSVTTLEVCGSWSDNDYVSVSGGGGGGEADEGRIRRSIADAMREQLQSSSSPSHNVVDTAEPPMEDARSDFSDDSPPATFPSI